MAAAGKAWQFRFWIVLGGALTSTLRGRLVPRLLRHHLLAIFLPLLAAAPVAPVVVLLRTWLGVRLFPGT